MNITKDIIKKFEDKGYTLETTKLDDDYTRLMGLSSNPLDLPIIENKEITTTYKLNTTKKTIYFFTKDENIFEVKELITTGYNYSSNGKLRKINTTKYEIEFNYEKYSLKNLKVFLGII